MLYFIFVVVEYPPLIDTSEASSMLFAVVAVVPTLSADAYFLFLYVNIILYISFEKLILKQPI